MPFRGINDRTTNLSVFRALVFTSYLRNFLIDSLIRLNSLSDADYHHQLKQLYREAEMALMLQQLKDNPNKVPSRSHNEMMRMLNSTWNKLDINNVQAFKKIFVTNSLDGSQDYLVSLI